MKISTLSKSNSKKGNGIFKGTQQEIKSFQANKAHKSGDTIHQERYH